MKDKEKDNKGEIKEKEVEEIVKEVTEDKAEKEVKEEKKVEKAEKVEPVVKEKVEQKKPEARAVRRNSENFKIVVGTLVAVITVCSVFALGLSIYNFYNGKLTISGDGNVATFTEGSISEVANKVSPAVVSIKTETRVSGYFGQSSTASAAGTGMIVTSDGYVITNKHVVEDANSVSVVMDDGTEYSKVEIVGTDPVNDVAYLKIKDVSDLPTVKLGNSKTVTVGQQVIAIGNALGQYQNSVTAGIVSGIGRTIAASDSNYSSYEVLSDMIQTDASINAGNSGGPVVNAAGEVIGINTAVSSGNGIGFAIPISSVKGMLKSIIENGKVERSYMGVNYINLTPDVAKSLELDVSAGAYISSDSGSAVVADSPADKAGIKDEDIIIEVNGAKIGSAGTLSSLLGEYTVGDTVELTLLRDGKQEKVRVTLEAYPKTNSSSSKKK